MEHRKLISAGVKAVRLIEKLLPVLVSAYKRPLGYSTVVLLGLEALAKVHGVKLDD